MQPNNPYAKSKTVVHWTRIELLIALYDEAIQRGRQSLATDNTAAAIEHRLQLVKIVRQLRNGLDHNHGEVPEKIEQLLEFVEYAFLGNEVKMHESSLRVLKTLRDAFDAIKETGIQMEREGKLQSVDHASAHSEQIA